MTLQWQAFNPVRNANGENCGTGAGGFKPNNTCGSHDKRYVSREQDTLRGMAKELHIPGIEIDDKHQQIGGYADGGAAEHHVRQVLAAARNAGFTEEHAAEPITGKPGQWRLRHPEGHVLTIDLYNTRPGAGGWRVVRQPYAIFGVDFVPRDHREGYAVTLEATNLSRRAGWPSPTIADLARLGQYEDAARNHQQLAIEHRHHPSHSSTIHKEAEAAHLIARDYHMEKAGLQ